MRFDLSAKASQTVSPKIGTIPLSITIRPANCCPGSFEYKSNSRALLNMLRDATDLCGYLLANFDGELHSRSTARLRGIEINDGTLHEIGYFID